MAIVYRFICIYVCLVPISSDISMEMDSDLRRELSLSRCIRRSLQLLYTQRIEYTTKFRTRRYGAQLKLIHFGEVVRGIGTTRFNVEIYRFVHSTEWWFFTIGVSARRYPDYLLALGPLHTSMPLWNFSGSRMYATTILKIPSLQWLPLGKFVHFYKGMLTYIY